MKEEFILENYHSMRMVDIAEKLGVSLASVKRRIRVLRKKGADLPVKQVKTKKVTVEKKEVKNLKTKKVDYSKFKYVQIDKRTWVLKPKAA